MEYEVTRKNPALDQYNDWNVWSATIKFADPVSADLFARIQDCRPTTGTVVYGVRRGLKREKSVRQDPIGSITMVNACTIEARFETYGNANQCDSDARQTFLVNVSQLLLSMGKTDTTSV